MYDDTVLPLDGTLVWPDIHHHTDTLIKFLSKNGDKFPKRIFLGDYFDDFFDTTLIAENTAKVVKELLSDPRNVLCMGNHDIPYMFPWIRKLYCPGFDPDKCAAIQKVLNQDDWLKMHMAVIEQGWLLSHAGVHISHLGMPFKDTITIEDALDVCKKGLERTLTSGDPPPIMLAGHDRGFQYQSLGGVMWLDWNRFKAIDGINQIVGHSPIEAPMVNFKKVGSSANIRQYLRTYKANVDINDPGMVSINWNLDTNNRYFGVLKDGKFFAYPTIHFL